MMEDDRRSRKQEERAQHKAERRGRSSEADQDLMDTKNQSAESVEAQIRKRVERRIKERDAFVRHLVAYVAVNAMLWAIWAMTSRSFPWPMFVTLGWGIGLASNAIQV